MDRKRLEEQLRAVRDHRLTVEEAAEHLQDLPFKDLGFARVDHHRELRRGLPEVIYCAGKTADQVAAIAAEIAAAGDLVVGTRASREQFQAVARVLPHALYHDIPHMFIADSRGQATRYGLAAVVSAGTSDLPVAEEAALMLEVCGHNVYRFYDVGVAGLHRLLDVVADLRRCQVVVVVAGMDGALAAVVAGMVSAPIIAVPTSVGYGASFGGLAALLAMLNACSSGVGVVNIDNGFGAAVLAHSILAMAASAR
ncbi:MAG: nickel pincer cofactor biosynthesis protein LarB [Clostridia bacterium]|nr:MAG: nickel pincer cofactor biosynthesis protein LarB [Clostridia bacterium]